MAAENILTAKFRELRENFINEIYEYVKQHNSYVDLDSEDIVEECDSSLNDDISLVSIYIDADDNNLYVHYTMPMGDFRDSIEVLSVDDLFQIITRIK